MEIGDVKRARDGDHEAFARLMAQLEGPMYGLARQMLRRDEDCADAMQETVLSAFKTIHTLREPAYFRTWVMRILINVCNRMLKQRSRQVLLSDVPEQPAEDDYGDVELHEAVERLERPMRLVVLLHYVQDLPVKEVAKLLRISQGTVKSRLFRAREKLLGWLVDSKEGGNRDESRGAGAKAEGEPESAAAPRT